MLYVIRLLEQEIISIESKKEQYVGIKKQMRKDKYFNPKVIEMIEGYDKLINQCKEAIVILSEAERN